MRVGSLLKDGLRRAFSRPVTIQYPLRGEAAAPEGYRGVVAYDQSLCVGCVLCVKFCPSGAITVVGDKQLSFDLGRCIYCGQCVEVCPRKAIKLTNIFELVSEKRKSFIVQGEQVFNATASTELK